MHCTAPEALGDAALPRLHVGTELLHIGAARLCQGQVDAEVLGVVGVVGRGVG